jgi:hypothetical protein
VDDNGAQHAHIRERISIVGFDPEVLAIYNRPRLEVAP